MSIVQQPDIPCLHRNLLQYVDKKKIETWITQQRSNSAELEIQNLDISANIVESFENPKISEGKIEKQVKKIDDSKKRDNEYREAVESGRKGKADACGLLVLVSHHRYTA